MTVRITDADLAMLSPDVRSFLAGLKGSLVEKSQAKPPKRNKYRAVKTSYKGVNYDSKAEAARAESLDRMEAAGLIRWWHTKPGSFRLGCPENIYRPDFMVCESDGSVRCEDVKGVQTRKFIKDKLLWKRYGKMPLHVIGGKQVEVVEPEANRNG